MGSVWLGRHLQLGSQHAIKVLKPEAAFFDRNLQRFLREARLMAQLQSAHVVRVTDHGYHDVSPFFVMEYLAGESLRDRLKARGRLTIQDTATLLLHVARGLTKAHELGLVHRDIKPANLFVTRAEADGAETVKILDFGIAKVTDHLTSDGVDPTETGALLGTPYYVSPEQAKALKTIDYRADLWSLGVVAFECLTGARPFYADAVGPLLATIVHGPIPVPSAVAPDAGLTPAIEAWLQRVLQREPTARFETAMEMAEAFWAAAGLSLDQPGTAPAAVVQAQSTVALETVDDSLVATNPQAAATAVAVPNPQPALPYAPAGTAGDPSFAEQTVPEPPMAGPSKGVVAVIVAVLGGLLVLGGLGFGGWWWLTSDGGADTEETDDDDDNDDDNDDEAGEGQAAGADTSGPGPGGSAEATGGAGPASSETAAPADSAVPSATASASSPPPDKTKPPPKGTGYKPWTHRKEL